MESDPVTLPARDGNHSEQQCSRACSPERRASGPGPRRTRPRRVAGCGSTAWHAEEGKTDPQLNAFSRLPKDVIERILYTVDANVFASLALLNRKWREISTCSKLYHHHLLGCRTPGSASHDPASSLSASDDIKTVRSRFTREARRNAFDVFLRPRRTLVNLISVSASSSSAFPQGEAFRFEFSAKGRQLLALSSSRIFVIDLTMDPISVLHELKTMRRPLIATIADEGTVLAMVSSEHQAHIYTLADGGTARLVQSIGLSDVPRALAFSPDAAILAVAYDGGIEVYAIGEDVLSTARRAVRCVGVDLLTFCCDGSMLLGASNNLRNSSFVTISPPLCNDPDVDLSVRELESRLWTTQILFPQVHEGYSHAVLIPSIKGGDGSPWFAGYNIESKAFCLAPIDGPNAEAIYFVGPGPDSDRDEPKPYIFPAASGNGELLAVGFWESELWVYGIPNMESHASTDSSLGEAADGQEKVPVWKSGSVATNFNRLKKTIDGAKTFVHGSSLRVLGGISAIKWVHDQGSGDTMSRKLCRLAAVAPGGVSSWLGAATGNMLPIDGGRILIYDFEYSPSNGKETEITIELGEVEPTKLPEPGSNLAQQVELERRRTHMNRRRGLGGCRDPSSMNPPRGPWRNQRLQPTSPANEGEDFALIDNPYNNSSPRSRDTINRASAATNRLDPRYRNARQVQSDGRRFRYLPHESDADNWVPPPPPYTPNAEAPLPEHLRRTLLPAATEPTPRNDVGRNQLRRSRTSRLESMAQSVIHRSSTRVNRNSNTLLQPPDISPTPRPPLPMLNTNYRASNYSARSPNTTSPLQNAPVLLSEPHNANSQSAPASQQTTQFRPSSHTIAGQASTSTTSHQGPMQARIQNQNASLVPSAPHTAPLPRNALNMRSLPPTPVEAETRRSWYNTRPQANNLHHGTPHPRPASHGNPVASSLRVHQRNNLGLSADHVLAARSHGVQRSRSRSQDAGRLMPLANYGLRDRRTGRNVLGSQSSDWLSEGGSQGGRRDGKCAVM
ncbi:F-box domain containing protein [Coccidioides posadasii C735 delta SOWgp]|uniref:F-box domain containing protein n=1 Tax=Coccidioides posadasii (strain C735) TaxID=222929 RepID=C5P1L8_COCP7|nr:F-box domain containing protein [Coccidioides posadasii C735 delta SOWgp]EER29576.1 F-box domain containing protein [Coccidioides posadasii C735 delta SOWgp]|eukprot:XP_003071721.1 F-box domain containing protein [Coccidioides posadasii C735 delta SOWgp]